MTSSITWYFFQVKIKMENKAKDKCKQIADELASHLRNWETVRKMFLNWHEGKIVCFFLNVEIWILRIKMRQCLRNI